MTNTSNVALQPHRLILLLFLLLAILGTSVAFAQTVIRQRDVPFVIKSPGSYVLGSNLIVSNPNVTAILVNADNVTIDLAGFAIVGPNLLTGNGAGIDFLGPYNNVSVRNGTVRGFHKYAVACVNMGGLNASVEDLRVQDCDFGIFISDGGIVRGCQVSNSAVGIDADKGSLIVNNTLLNNWFRGLGLESNGPPPSENSGVTAIGNIFRNNGSAIVALHSGGHRIEGNTLVNNPVGIDLSDGSSNYFARNFLKGNTTPIVSASGNIDGGTIDPALANVVIP